MTDPETLTPEERSQYIRQLQRTVGFWQRAYAATQGQTHEELLKIAASLYRTCEPKDYFQRTYECEWTK